MALSFNNVTYKSNLKKFNYDFEDGKITTIVSGESLSYFTYLMSNLEKDYNGKITNTYKGRNIGVVFNNPEEAFIFNTVREELEFGLKKYNYKVSTINKRIEDSLKMVNLPKEYLDKSPFELPNEVKEEVEIQIKYEGYIKLQEEQVEKFKKLENKVIPEKIRYDEIKGLRLEARQKLDKVKPISVGQASRISGVSPADISVLLVYLEQMKGKI